MSLPRLTALTTQDQRQVNGVTRHLAEANDRNEFAQIFIEEISRCLPGEMSGWGETTADYTQFTGMAVSPAYLTATMALVAPISRHLDCHPALRAVGWRGARDCPRRISDFASHRRFTGTPLYRDAYRHLDADHQIAFSPGCFEGTGIVISLNRKRSDYSDRECQKFHLLGDHVRQLLEDLTVRAGINRQLQAIESRWPLPTASAQRLTAGDLRQLARLARSGTAATTVPMPDRKALYQIMDKLELDSRAQLLALLHELQP